MSVFLELLGALVIAVVASWVTVRLSLRSFLSQRWWEMKADAYSQIMEQLSHLEYYEARYLEAMENFGDPSAERHKLAAEESAEASRALRKAAAIGALIISEKAADALDELYEPQDLNMDLYEEVAANLSGTRACMKASARKRHGS